MVSRFHSVNLQLSMRRTMAIPLPILLGARNFSNLTSPTPALMDFSKEPGPRKGPGALDRADRHTQFLPGLLLSQPDKKAEFDDLRGARISSFQVSERLIQRQQVVIG